MGTLSPPFILCPLSDRRELLGLSEDRLQNKVVVTIGRNIAIRYHILEQKQETSWTISRHWFTSRVVYCSEIDRYGAIMDNTIIALWEDHDTALDKVFKFKFTDNIYELRPTRELETLIIFENGCIVSLRTATADKKNKTIATNKGLINNEKEVIIDCEIDEENHRAILIVGKKSNNVKNRKNPRHIQKREMLRMLIVPFLVSDNSCVSNEISCELEILLDSDIMGHCVVCEQQECYIVLIGSDGKVYQHTLKEESSVTTVGFLGKYVSAKTPVVMRYIRESSTFIVYGSDASEEGAVVFMYDLKYDLLVSKQSLKMYGTPPIMEKVGGNVMVPVGLHLLVLGYRSSKCLLSTVVGKHSIRFGEEVFEQRNPFDEPQSAWEVDKDVSTLPQSALKKKKQKTEIQQKKEMELVKKSFPDFWEVVQQFRILEKEGQPESLICNQIVPMILKSHNLAAIEWLLNTFTDVPENFLIIILSFLLDQLTEPIITKQKKAISSPGSSDQEIENTTYQSDSAIEEILQRSFDNKELVKQLPSLAYDKVKKFILYLKSRMESHLNGTEDDATLFPSQNHGTNNLESYIKWMSVLLDAHYTQLVFNNEKKLIEEILTILDNGTKFLDEIEELSPFLLMTYNKVDFKPRPNPNNKWRTEIITFV